MANAIGEPRWRGVEHLARDLILASEDEPGRGRAVFLIGAGCSVSAGIPSATGVAKHCAVRLARQYSRGAFAGEDAEGDAIDALTWLVGNGHVDHKEAYGESGDQPRWGPLYTHFFEEHLKAPNQQRTIISDLVEAARGKLNWAHACLGELVRQRHVHSVLTTNFDQLVLTGIFRSGLIPVVADGMFALNRIVARPLVPQVVHLHGSMHTYNLRNSRQSLSETKEDARAVTMINGILQQCDVLVVVGYAGGEEGVMQMLLEASRSLEQLVVYWVAYEGDVSKLSVGCRELLSGENKFAIKGGEADRFFADLMAQLEIGQPDWVADPTGELARQPALLVAPTHVPEVGILIDAFTRKIEVACGAVGQWQGGDPRKLLAARKRAAGDFRGARETLEGTNPAADAEAARLHALNALSLFEENPSEELRPMLDAAIAEFETLIGRTEGTERLENVFSLIDAKFDLFELDGARKALEDVIQIAERWLPGDPEAAGPGEYQLWHYRALAHHRLADAADEDEHELELAEADYRTALHCLERAENSPASILEVREGLAGALQVLARKRRDEAKAREAVRLFRDVAENTRRDRSSPQEGGLLYNLSGALMDLIDQVDEEEAILLREEALGLLGRAAAVFERLGDSERLADVERLRASFTEARLAAEARKSNTA